MKLRNFKKLAAFLSIFTLATIFSFGATIEEFQTVLSESPPIFLGYTANTPQEVEMALLNYRDLIKEGKLKSDTVKRIEQAGLKAYPGTKFYMFYQSDTDISFYIDSGVQNAKYDVSLKSLFSGTAPLQAVARTISYYDTTYNLTVTPYVVDISVDFSDITSIGKKIPVKAYLIILCGTKTVQDQVAPQPNPWD